jgi:hypothetical protein
MSIEGLITLLIVIAVVALVAWAVVWFLGQAGVPQMIISIVWIIAALICLLLLLRFIGVLNLHLSWLPMAIPWFA